MPAPDSRSRSPDLLAGFGVAVVVALARWRTSRYHEVYSLWPDEPGQLAIARFLGGRDDTGMEAVAWIKKGVALGAGEIVLNSIDTDGTKDGFDLDMLRAVCDAVSVPVVASGGAGGIGDFVTLFKEVPGVDAGLAASIFHFGEVEIRALKRELAANGINVRLI